MNETLNELINGSTVILEIDKLNDLLKYTMSLPDYYSFRFEYPDDKLVKVTLIGKDTIIKY